MEEWRDIEGYEGLYQVSNYGRVKSLDRMTTQKTRSGYWITRPYKGRVLKQSTDDDGYKIVTLTKPNEKGKSKRVNVLVAKAWIPNPDNKPIVGHTKKLDDGTEDKTANEVWNLQWMTQKENCNYGTLLQRKSEMMKKGYTEGKMKKVWLGKKRPEHSEKMSIPIVEIKEDGTVVEWSSTKACAEECGHSFTRLILAVNGKNRNIGHHFKSSDFYKKDDYEKQNKELTLVCS